MGSEVMVEELANILQAETAAKEEDEEDEEEETERRQADEDRGKDWTEGKRCLSERTGPARGISVTRWLPDLTPWQNTHI